MSYQIVDTATAEQINAVANHPLQSWEWGEARKAMGTEIVRIGKLEGDTLIKSYLMTIHPIPMTKALIGYIPRSNIPDEELLEFLKDFAKDRQIIFVKFEPDTNKSDSAQKEIHTLQQKFNIKRSPHRLFPDWTMELDISPAEEELLQNLKQKTRYNIRLASKKGVVVKEMNTEEGFEIFSKLYFETTKRQNYYGHNKEYHRIVWDNLKHTMATILVSFYENTPLGAYELFTFKNKLYYPYGGSSEEHRNVMGPNLLMWEAIRYGKSKECAVFDMWGAASPEQSQSSAFAGFTRFKEGYNAQFVEKIGSYDFIINPGMFSLYTVSYKLRNWYLSLRVQ